MKSILFIISLLISLVGNTINNGADIAQVVQKVRAAYQHSNLQLSYQLKTYFQQTVIQESKGFLLKSGSKFYKEMDLVTMVTDGKYAITIDKRIMTIFYNEVPNQSLEYDLMPDLSNVDLRIISKSNEHILVRNRIINEALDSTDYYVNQKTGMFELVRHYKTHEGELYRTDIQYDNQKAREVPDKSHFDLNRWVTGKGKRARLNSIMKNEGFIFINSLKKSN